MAHLNPFWLHFLRGCIGTRFRDGLLPSTRSRRMTQDGVVNYMLIEPTSTYWAPGAVDPGMKRPGLPP